MNELVNAHKNQWRCRHGLLVTVSVFALVGAANRANASDSGRPSVWVELSGQFAQEQASQEAYLPAFLASSPFITPASDWERSSPASWDGSAKVCLLISICRSSRFQLYGTGQPTFHSWWGTSPGSGPG